MRIIDPARLIEAELDGSALVTAMVRNDMAGVDAVLANAEWRLVAETLGAWLSDLICQAAPCGHEDCIENIRSDVLNHLRRCAGPEPPPGPDSVST